jgi:hypothetical protein
MVDDSSPKRVGITPEAERREARIGSVSRFEFWEAGIEKSGTSKRAAEIRKKPIAP